jgi:hypothetical protein
MSQALIHCFDHSKFGIVTKPPSLAQQQLNKLASSKAQIGAKISDTIEDNPKIVNSCLRIQFKRLLVEPLSFLTEVQRKSTIVVVLDALDECGRVQNRKELLDLFSRESVRLPSALHFIFMSCKEFDIHL